MPTTTRNVIDAVFDDLSADATLTAEISAGAFYRGNVLTAKAMFPFLSVGAFSYTNEARSIGARAKDVRTYTINVFIGTKSLTGVSSYNKMLDLIELAHLAIRVNQFGVFSQPARIGDVTTTIGPDPAGFVWVAQITMTGEVLVARNA